jgi:uncharacterized membrane protein YidH (DUF202 family)
MVVLVLINDEGNLRCSSRAFEFKRARENPFGIVSHEARNHVRTSLGVCIIKFGIAALRARLMKRKVTFRVFLTGLYLPRVDDIVGITETIVGQTNRIVLIPSPWLISWL